MKVLFAGPSIYGIGIDLAGIEVRAPAAHGDLLRATLDGANVIGLIDGAFEATAAVWHKEILYALSEGVAVLGGASMGALRAAECAAFGMEPVGVIAHRYLNGESDDDADVAITHGPEELGSPPLTEALVDCLATIEALAAAAVLSTDEAAQAARVARDMFYKERTISRFVRAAFPSQADKMETAYMNHRVSLKTADALAVIERVKASADRRSAPKFEWRLNEPPMWRETLTRIINERVREKPLAEDPR